MGIALLVNPAARSGARPDGAVRAAHLLRERGITTTVISGGSAAESSQLLRTAIDVGVDAVVVAGGDGTVNLALPHLAGTGIPLGILPTGTGNDTAGMLGVADLDVDRAVELIAAGRTRDIDLARVTRSDSSSQLYATVLACGFDSKVNDRANRMRWPRGRSRYTIAVLIEFVRLAGLEFTVEIEDAEGTAERLDSALLMATVGNGRTYGGGIPICPDADPADGLLDVTLVRPAGRLQLLRLLRRVYRGAHMTAPQVIVRTARRVRLTAPGVSAYADGDPLGLLPLEIEVVPAALRVFCEP